MGAHIHGLRLAGLLGFPALIQTRVLFKMSSHFHGMLMSYREALAFIFSLVSANKQLSLLLATAVNPQCCAKFTFAQGISPVHEHG